MLTSDVLAVDVNIHEVIPVPAAQDKVQMMHSQHPCIPCNTVLQSQRLSAVLQLFVLMLLQCQSLDEVVLQHWRALGLPLKSVRL